MAEALPHHLPLNGIYQGGILLATTGNYNHTGSTDIAQLIAAAPELLEVLKEVTRAIENLDAPLRHSFDGIFYRIDQVISKAEGK